MNAEDKEYVGTFLKEIRYLSNIIPRDMIIMEKFRTLL